MALGGPRARTSYSVPRIVDSQMAQFFANFSVKGFLSSARLATSSEDILRYHNWQCHPCEGDAPGPTRKLVYSAYDNLHLIVSYPSEKVWSTRWKFGRASTLDRVVKAMFNTLAMPPHSVNPHRPYHPVCFQVALPAMSSSSFGKGSDKSRVSDELWTRWGELLHQILSVLYTLSMTLNARL